MFTTAEKINEVLKSIFEKDTTTIEEKKALLEACDCVYKAKSNKVIDEDSFKQLLFDNMTFDYDIEVKVTDVDTQFLVKTFKKID